MMIVLDYCVQEYVQRNGHTDICYLAHPALVHIARYDARCGTNLRQVLYQYLVFGGNVQRAAAALYMHRNTVMNKLKKYLKWFPWIFPTDCSVRGFCFPARFWSTRKRC